MIRAKRRTRHTIIPGHMTSGEWIGSFTYLAPSPEILGEIRETLHNTCPAMQATDRSVIRTVTTEIQDPN